MCGTQGNNLLKKNEQGMRNSSNFANKIVGLY